MAKQRNDSLARALGQEPTFTEPTKLNLIEALNWYNYNSDDGNYKIWLRQFLAQQKSFSKSDIAKATSGDVPRAIAALARMESRGVATGEQARVIAFAMKAIESSTYVEEEDVVPTNVISIRDRLKESCTPYVAWIDQQIDNFIAGKPYDDNIYDYLNGQGCKAGHARMIREAFEFNFSEMALLKDGDPAVVECYEAYGKKAIKVLVAFYEKLESDLAQLEQTKKAARVRKVRKPNVEKMLSKVKYLKESTEFKVGSIHPQKVLGSEQLWIFNTKTRQLGRYVGSNIQFKRSSLLNIELEQSVSKKLRKPEEFLKVVMNASKSQLNKQFDAIKAVAKPMNGRLNEFTVLLRVW
jgi:hypothetical protein